MQKTKIKYNLRKKPKSKQTKQLPRVKRPGSLGFFREKGAVQYSIQHSDGVSDTMKAEIDSAFQKENIAVVATEQATPDKKTKSPTAKALDGARFELLAHTQHPDGACSDLYQRIEARQLPSGPFELGKLALDTELHVRPSKQTISFRVTPQSITRDTKQKRKRPILPAKQVYAAHGIALGPYEAQMNHAQGLMLGADDRKPGAEQNKFPAPRGVNLRHMDEFELPLADQVEKYQQNVEVTMTILTSPEKAAPSVITTELRRSERQVTLTRRATSRDHPAANVRRAMSMWLQETLNTTPARNNRSHAADRSAKRNEDEPTSASHPVARKLKL